MEKKDKERTRWNKVQKSRLFFKGLLAVCLIFILAYHVRQEQAEAIYREQRL